MKKRISAAVLAICFSLLAGTASAYDGMENRPLIATESKITTGDQNPVVTVTTSNARFAAEALPLDRYEIYNANTELTLSSVTQDNDTHLTFQFTGTAAVPGSYLSIHIPAEGFAQSDMEYLDSNLLYVYVLSLDGTIPEGADTNPGTPNITIPVESDAEIGHLESVDTIITRDFEEITISGTGECYLQSMLKEDKTYADWIDRIDIPDYASGFYHTLAENSDKTNLSDLLVKDDYYTIQPAAAAPQRQSYEVTAAQTVQFAIPDAFAGADSNPLANPDYFTDDKYNTVDITEADKNINYPALKAGEVVMTPNFNGIYVTKVKKTDNPSYEANRKDACTYISAAFHAFDRDHPEVFWLSGVSKEPLI